MDEIYLMSKIDAQELLGKGRQFVQKIPVFKATQVHRKFVLHDNNVKVAGKSGDWLICTPEGGLGIVDKDAFNKQYEEVRF